VEGGEERKVEGPVCIYGRGGRGGEVAASKKAS
jgi:hypothetical protein